MIKRLVIYMILLFLSLQFTKKWLAPKQMPTQEKAIIESPEYTEEKPSDEEKFYVLENEYMQLVFSNLGGSIAEINLPFENKNNKSIVKKIEIDRQILEQSPENSKFPLNPSKNYENKIIQSEKGGYYPLLRRSVKNKNGYERYIGPKYYSTNLSESEEPYELLKIKKNLIQFQLKKENQTIIKTYTIPTEDIPYIFHLDVQADGNRKDLFISSGIPEAEFISKKTAESILKYRYTKKQKPAIEKISLPKTAVKVFSIYPDWVSNANSYFGIILDPLQEKNPGYKAAKIPGTAVPTRYTLIDQKHHLYPEEKYPGYEISLPLSNVKENHFRIYAGPLSKETLERIDAIYSNALKNYDPNYSLSMSFHGIFSKFTEPFSQFLFLLMKLFHSITKSWGLSIILITIVFRLILYPLNAWQIKSSENMKTLQPKMKSLEEKYKKDPKRLQMEKMKLFREQGVNPFKGCFPVFIQFPFFIALYNLLKNSFELRGVSFIPGWIDNLSSPDVLFSWNTPIIFFGTAFHLLPFINAFFTYIQQKVMTDQQNTSMTEEQKKQKQMMTYFLPIMFLFITYNLPSGLNIYWISSTILGILQWWIFSKKKSKIIQIK